MARTLIYALVLAALALAAPLPGATGTAAAQEPSGLDRARAALPEDAARRLERLVADARAEGLPAEPIVQKALEGTAKSVPPDRILGAVEQLATRLGRAQRLLADGASPPPTDVSAVADALGRGVPEPAVRSVRDASPAGEPVALAVHTLADLMDRGVPTDQALQVLDAWRDRGGQAAELRELPAAVERLIREGVLPEQAAAAVAGAMRSGRPPATAGPPQAGPPSGVLRGPPGQPPIPPGAGPPSNAGEQGKNKGKGKRGGGSGG